MYLYLSLYRSGLSPVCPPEVYGSHRIGRGRNHPIDPSQPLPSGLTPQEIGRLMYIHCCKVPNTCITHQSGIRAIMYIYIFHTINSTPPTLGRDFRQSPLFVFVYLSRNTDPDILSPRIGYITHDAIFMLLYRTHVNCVQGVMIDLSC